MIKKSTAWNSSIEMVTVSSPSGSCHLFFPISIPVTVGQWKLRAHLLGGAREQQWLHSHSWQGQTLKSLLLRGCGRKQSPWTSWMQWLPGPLSHMQFDVFHKTIRDPFKVAAAFKETYPKVEALTDRSKQLQDALAICSQISKARLSHYVL